ncbi:MAG: glycosyltransferase family 2 protein [Bacteroidetes bacterium]|nr:glycosyltransferase family 2 protein [Bacteroidota bacterium]
MVAEHPKISFVIPLYNESEIFTELISRLRKLIDRITDPCEIIFIDDGSKDNTALLMQELAYADKKYHCIFLSRNFGHQFAVSAGLEFAMGEYIMVLDGDLQDPPELFFEFYKKLSEGYDVVYGIRKKRKEGVLKRATYYLFYRILKSISAYSIPLDSGDFAMITKRVAKIIVKMPEQSRFLRGMRSWVGFKQIGIEYERDARGAGDSKYSFRQLLKLGSDGVFNFSTFPIKFFTILGVCCMMSSVIYFLYTLYRKMFYNDVPVGFPALLFVIILFGGIQLLSIGVIGEYVQRIFSQVKNRPLYLISKRVVNGKDVADE